EPARGHAGWIPRGRRAARRASVADGDRPGGRVRPGDDRAAGARDAARLRVGVVRFDPGYLRHVVERLESFHSHPLGFRVAGTPEERKATKFIASEMRDLGLEDVVEEPVPVDGWRLQEAFV